MLLSTVLFGVALRSALAVGIPQQNAFDDAEHSASHDVLPAYERHAIEHELPPKYLPHDPMNAGALATIENYCTEINNQVGNLLDCIIRYLDNGQSHPLPNQRENTRPPSPRPGSIHETTQMSSHHFEALSHPFF